MGFLLEHLAAVTPRSGLVGVGVRHLKDTPGDRNDCRGMGPFYWVPAVDLPDVAEAFTRRLADKDLVDLWTWIERDCGGPERAARGQHLHGERPYGALMLRPVFCPEPPANGGGRLDELDGVVGLPIDVDVRSRRPGDRRLYCPTVPDAVRTLELFSPSVMLDAGGGVVGVWLFDEPADPYTAKRLGHDLVAAMGRVTADAGWHFDSPAPHSAWVKFPGVPDRFRRHITTEIAHGPVWTFEALRRAVPWNPYSRPSTWTYSPGAWQHERTEGT